MVHRADGRTVGLRLLEPLSPTRAGEGCRRKHSRAFTRSPHRLHTARAMKTAIVVGATAELVVTSIALRDLVGRPKGQVRGSKLLWFFSFFVQPVGAPLYLLVGRRRTA